jgi:hypothetical protein
MRAPIAWLWLCSWLAAAPASADARLTVLSRIKSGAQVRLAVEGDRFVEGRLVQVGDGQVLLDRAAEVVPIATIHAVWVRGDSTKTAASIGALGVGLATGALAALISTAFCDSGDACGGAAVTGGAVGLLAGAAAGGLTGGVVGTAIPKWHRVYPADAPPPARAVPTNVPIAREPSASPAPPAAPTRFGSAGLDLGFARGRDLRAGSGGLGGHFRLSMEGRGFTPSLEIGRFDLGHGDVMAPNGRPIFFDESVVHVGAALSRTLGHGKVRPYGLAALGHYTWRGFDSRALDPHRFDSYSVSTRHFLGGSLGGGVRVRSVGPLSFGLEGRWHTSLNEVSRPSFQGAVQHWNMLSITAGAGVSW